MIKQRRVNFTAYADYSKGSKIEKIVFAVLEKIKSTDAIINMHIADEEVAKEE